MRSIEGGLSAVLDGDVGEAVGEVGELLHGRRVVDGDGVAAGVGPDDADSGGSGLDERGECELGEGDVGLELGVEVVGGVDALASGQKGQPVGGEAGSLAARILSSDVGQKDLLVLEPVEEACGGVVLGAEGGVELPEEVAAGAGDVGQGDGEAGIVQAALVCSEVFGVVGAAFEALPINGNAGELLIFESGHLPSEAAVAVELDHVAQAGGGLAAKEAVKDMIKDISSVL